MKEEILGARAASSEDIRKWKENEEARRNDARHRLLSAILQASEFNELCNTLWDDELLRNIKADVRTLVREWIEMLSKKEGEE